MQGTKQYVKTNNISKPSNIEKQGELKRCYFVAHDEKAEE